jgi:hypothetical protein
MSAYIKKIFAIIFVFITVIKADVFISFLESKSKTQKNKRQQINIDELKNNIKQCFSTPSIFEFIKKDVDVLINNSEFLHLKDLYYCQILKKNNPQLLMYIKSNIETLTNYFLISKRSTFYSFKSDVIKLKPNSDYVSNYRNLDNDINSIYFFSDLIHIENRDAKSYENWNTHYFYRLKILNCSNKSEIEKCLIEK